jgi:hypothetical protein
VAPGEVVGIHYGEIEHRSIYGEASPDEAKARGLDNLSWPRIFRF